MALSYSQVTADGVNKVYTFTFKYINKSHVAAYVDGVSASFSWITAYSIELDDMPPQGAIVLIRRVTPATSKMVDFNNGSINNEAIMDLSVDNQFMIAQEILDNQEESILYDPADNKYDAQNRIIKNVTNGVDNTDVATVGQIKPYADAAEAAKEDAEASANSAAIYALNQYSVEAYGCVGDANYYKSADGKWYVDAAYTILSTDNYTNLTAAITAANAAGRLLNLNGKTYYSSQEITLPSIGLADSGRIVGCNCKWYRVKNTRTYGQFRCDSLLLSGIWFATIDRLYVDGDLTIDGGSSSVWGSFWNYIKFIQTVGTLIFDVDKSQSVNQNIINTAKCSGGVHIKGVNTSGIRECHNNLIMNLDTTGASLTSVDGTTGCHLLNDSNANQPNTIMNWYAESGSLKVVGEWNILCSAVDSTYTSFIGGRKRHYLMAGGTGRNSDYFAGTPINRGRGGSWKQLSNLGRPLDVSVTGSVSVVGVSDAPDGNPLALRVVATGTYNAINFTYPLGSQPDMGFAAFIRLQNRTVTALEYSGTGGGVVSAPFSIVDCGNGWSLIRSSGYGRYLGDGSTTGSTGNIRLYLTTSTTAATPPQTYELGSYFIATEQTVFLPQYEQGRKEAYGSSIPTAGIWKAGDVCHNTAPVSGGNAEWVCTIAGDFRTLSGITGSITTGTKDLVVNSADGLYIGASITIAGVTGTRVIKAMSGTSITVDVNADATVTDAAIAYVTPVWNTYGTIS